jgi:hypothetical protein
MNKNVFYNGKYNKCTFHYFCENSKGKGDYNGYKIHTTTHFVIDNHYHLAYNNRIMHCNES